MLKYEIMVINQLELQRCVLTLSWEDIEEKLPSGISLTDDEKRQLFDETARSMDGNDVIMEAFWTIIEDSVSDLEG